MANKAGISNVLNKRIHFVARRFYEMQMKDEREKYRNDPTNYTPPEHIFSFYEFLDALNARYSKSAIRKMAKQGGK